MERITSIKLPGELINHFDRQDPLAIRSAEPYEVSSFSDLVRWSAEIAVANPSFMVLYRGQNNEYKSKDNALLLPSLYRWKDSKAPSDGEIRSRANILNRACNGLIARVKHSDAEDQARCRLDQLEKRPSLCWAILQHYEYCATPYLDVTQSLRIAAMFAFDGCKAGDKPCVYCLGFPFATDKFFRDSNDELMVLRLLSAMPPIAKRAYFQEGYLVGSEFDKINYTKNNDVAQRLLAKFALVGDKHEWMRQIGTYPRKDVYSNDFFSQIREEVMTPIVGDGAHAAPCSRMGELENPEAFPSLAVG